MEINQITCGTNKLREQNLDDNQYTISLLKEGFRTGYIDKRDVFRIQEDIMLVLKDLIVRYTGGASTSIMVDTAERLLNSVYYALDAGIKGCTSPEHGLKILRTEKISEIYSHGIELITECLAQTKLTYQQMLKNRLDVENDVYNDTIDAIINFFENYQIVFSAHDTMVDIDYPLVFDDMRVRGVYYIKQYIEKLDIENRFCRMFDILDVCNVYINGGSRIYGIDCRQIPLNIFEVIFNNSLFTIFAGNDPDKILLSEYEFKVIKHNLITTDKYKMDSTILKAAERMIDYFQISDKEMINYICRYSAMLSTRLKNVLENDGFDKMIIIDSKANLDIKKTIFEDGIRLDDKSFKTIVKSISDCKNTHEKIELIKSKIHSASDLIDILDTGCLYGEECILLFSSIDDIELSILGRYLFGDELKDNSWSIEAILNNKSKLGIDKEWNEYYIDFLRTCGNGRLKNIECYIQSIGA